MAGAMEQMLANMLGINPGEMAAMAGQVQTGLLAMTSSLKTIQDQNVEILERLERIENAGSGNNGRNSKRGTAVTNGATD